jgi:hypothetical protein
VRPVTRLVPKARHTADYCDGVEGLIAASSGGLREELIRRVFLTKADHQDVDTRTRDTPAAKLESVLTRLRRERRIVLLSDLPEEGKRWGVPAHRKQVAA